MPQLVRIIDLLSGEFEGVPIDQRTREANGELRYEHQEDQPHLTKLSKVYTKTDKRGKWLYWTWEPFDGLGHNCHYSGAVIEGDGEHIGYVLLNPEGPPQIKKAAGLSTIDHVKIAADALRMSTGSVEATYRDGDTEAVSTPAGIKVCVNGRLVVDWKRPMEERNAAFVIRHVVTFVNRDGMRTLWDSAQGQYTYGTPEEAQQRIDNARANNSRETLLGSCAGADTLEVRPCECWPGHFDPKGVWFD